MRTPWGARLTVPLLVAVAVAGCGILGSPSPSGIPHPGGDDLVLRVDHQGGMTIANGHLTNLPAYTLTGDGRVIMPGAQIEIFPGPALPAVQVRRLTEEGVQAILQAAAASGQFGADATWHGAQNFVADAPDTVFTLHRDGRTVTVRIHALGSVDATAPNIGADEKAAHAALQAFLDRITAPDEWLASAAWEDATWQPYTAEALRLVVRNADADEPVDGEIPIEELPWPVDGDAAAFGEPTALEGYRCGAVSGPDAVTWYEALAGANQMTRWTSGGHRYEVTVRPLLPDEAVDCPDLA